METPVLEKALPKRDLLIKEYEQVLVSYRENIKVLGQVLPFLVLANVSICVFAFQYKNGYIFLAGAILMYVLSRANHRAVQLTLPIVIRGLILENELGIVGLMNYTMIKVNDSGKFDAIIMENKLYDHYEDQKEQFKKVQKILNSINKITLKFDFPFALSKWAAFLIISLGVLQFLLFILAVLNGIYHLELFQSLNLSSQ